MKCFGDLNVFQEENEFNFFLLNNLVEEIEYKLINQSCFTLALSGGQTPFNFYKYLNNETKHNKKLYSLFQFVEIFIVDERSVPLESDESNSGNVLKALANVPSRINLINPEDANIVEIYKNNLFKIKQKNSLPNIDLIFLGVGLDGHVASLFPRSKYVNNDVELFVKNVLTDGSIRYSMTFPLIINASQRWFLINGKQKGEFLNSLINEKNKGLPIERLLKAQLKNKWFFLQ